jgi:ribosomal protein L5
MPAIETKTVTVVIEFTTRGAASDSERLKNVEEVLEDVTYNNPNVRVLSATVERV